MNMEQQEQGNGKALKGGRARRSNVARGIKEGKTAVRKEN